MQKMTRREAATSGLNKFYTGRPCIHGHDAERYTLTGICVECAKYKAKQSYQEHARLLREAREAA